MRFSRNLSSILWKIWKLRYLLKLLFHCTQKTDAREKHFVSNNSFERIERAVSLRRNAIEIFHETSINSLYKKEEPFLKRSFHKNRIILGRDRLSTFEKKKLKQKLPQKMVLRIYSKHMQIHSRTGFGSIKLAFHENAVLPVKLLAGWLTTAINSKFLHRGIYIRCTGSLSRREREKKLRKQAITVVSFIRRWIRGDNCFVVSNLT